MSMMIIGVVDNNVAPHCESLSIPECLDSIEISDDDVMSAIDKLKNKLSSGPDGLPPFLFKQLKFTLSKPLVLVFNQERLLTALLGVVIQRICAR